jgi:disulfide bond formation protein DsbB
MGCFVIAMSASLGSLFFSEVMDLPPCSLCWYQRVFMFPLAIVLLVGALTSDVGCVRYALPLAIGGWLVAAFHVLVQTGIIEETLAPCQEGVSCAAAQLQLFGFASIPVLSLLAFSALLAGLITIKTKYSR